MLHAIHKGKTKFYRRYLGERDGAEHKVYEEDEITSTILGPLEFLPVVDVYYFFSCLARKAGCESLLPGDDPEEVKIELWCRRDILGSDRRYIEPDGMVTFRFTSGRTLIFLLELKWRAPLSGDDQLHRQWSEFLNKEERSQALHLFIAPTITEGVKARQNKNLGDIWQLPQGNRLALVSWSIVRAILNDLIKDRPNTALGRWAMLADLFLEKIGIYNFSGFQELAVPVLSFNVNTHQLFWKGHSVS